MQARKSLEKYMILALFAAVMSTALKIAAYKLTHSVGILSDVLEGGSQLLTAVLGLGAVVYAATPPDGEHNFGHKKIEFFAGGLEGLTILATAVLVGFEAIKKLTHPSLPENVSLGASYVAVATVINLAIGWVLIKTGKENENLVLETDGQHLMSDVYTSLGVIVGVIVAKTSGIGIFDPLVAIAVALYILVIGWSLIKRAFDGLMDKGLPIREVKVIKTIIEENLGVTMSYHTLRTRKSGSERFVDYHLVVPGEK